MSPNEIEALELPLFVGSRDFKGLDLVLFVAFREAIHAYDNSLILAELDFQVVGRITDASLKPIVFDTANDALEH